MLVHSNHAMIILLPELSELFQMFV